VYSSSVVFFVGPFQVCVSSDTFPYSVRKMATSMSRVFATAAVFALAQGLRVDDEEHHAENPAKGGGSKSAHDEGIVPPIDLTGKGKDCDGTTTTTTTTCVGADCVNKYWPWHKDATIGGEPADKTAPTTATTTPGSLLERAEKGIDIMGELKHLGTEIKNEAAHLVGHGSSQASAPAKAHAAKDAKKTGATTEKTAEKTAAKKPAASLLEQESQGIDIMGELKHLGAEVEHEAAHLVGRDSAAAPAKEHAAKTAKKSGKTEEKPKPKPVAASLLEEESEGIDLVGNLRHLGEAVEHEAAHLVGHGSAAAPASVQSAAQHAGQKVQSAEALIDSILQPGDKQAETTTAAAAATPCSAGATAQATTAAPSATTATAAALGDDLASLRKRLDALPGN